MPAALVFFMYMNIMQQAAWDMWLGPVRSK